MKGLYRLHFILIDLDFGRQPTVNMILLFS